MKDITIVILLAVIIILTGMIDATLSLNDDKKDWLLEDLYNPTGEWCFPSEHKQPVPVDCQFQNAFLGKEIE